MSEPLTQFISEAPQAYADAAQSRLDARGERPRTMAELALALRRFGMAWDSIVSAMPILEHRLGITS